LSVIRKADRSKIRLWLNGHEVSSHLREKDCDRGFCTLDAKVTETDGLKVGSNSLAAEITGMPKTPGTVQYTSFLYDEQRNVGDSNTITYYEPASVGISTVGSGGNPLIQITTGNPADVNDPVANFPTSPGDSGTKISIPYPDSQFGVNCSATLQAIALDRAQPSVMQAAVCGNSLTDIQNNFQTSLGHTLDASSLVIMGTVGGNYLPANFDSTWLGGTKYAGVTVQPEKYMIIGVPGAPAGSAHESYDVAAGPDTPLQYAPFLNGTLVKSSFSGYYNYIPSDDRFFSVVSNSTQPTVTVGGQTYTAPPVNSQGAFWLLVLDRELLQPINYSTANWTTCAYDAGSQACGGIFNVSSDGGAALANTLASINPATLYSLFRKGARSPNLRNQQALSRSRSGFWADLAIQCRT
jgi:hypothetical protein